MIHRNLKNHVLRTLLICVVTLATMGGLFVGTAMAAAPTMTSITDDTDNDGTVDQLTITFSEASDIIDGNAGNGLASVVLTNGCTIPNGDYAADGTTTLVLSNLTGCTPGNTGITIIGTYTAVASCATENAICDDALANQMVNSTNTTAVDGAAPVILSAKYLDNDTNGAIDRVEFTTSTDTGMVCTAFTGATDTTVNTAGEVGLAAHASDSCATNGTSTFTITLNTVGTADTTGGATTPQITYTQPGNGLEDGAGNDVPTKSTLNVDDGAEPALLFFDYEDLNGDGTVDNIYLQFTEAIDDDVAGMTSADFSVTINTSSLGQGAVEMVETLNVGTADDNEIDIAFTNGTAFTTNADYEITIAASKVGDAGGNFLPSETQLDCDDEAPPVFASVDPPSSGFENDQDVSYTVSEALTTGAITWTQTGGSADAASPHTCALQGTALNSGTHTDLTMQVDANACAAWTSLVDGSEYTVDFDGDDGINPATTVSSTVVTYDITDPTPTVTVGSDPIYGGDLIQEVTIVYDEEMDPTSTPTVVLSGSWGAPSGGAWSTSGANPNDRYIVNFTHSGLEYLASATANVGAVSGANDLAFNSDTADASPSFVIDTVAPNVTSIVLTDPALTVGETSLVTITFTEPVAAFSNADITTIDNGTLTPVADQGGGVWTATFTPADDIEVGTNVITITETTLTDTAGNAGVGTTSSANYVIDTKEPTVAVVFTDTSLIIGETSLVTFTFHEVVTGFANIDITTIDNGTLTPVADQGGGVWTATFTPAVATEVATNVVTVNLTGVADSPGNTGVGTTDSNNYAIDTIAPNVVSVVLDDTAIIIGDTPTVTITFDEPVTSFSNGDFDVSAANGSMLHGVSSSDGGITWTTTFTPTSGVEDTSNVLTVVETNVNDLAGNPGVGPADPAETSANYTMDTLAPTLAETTPVTDPTNDQTPDVSFSSDEAGAISWAGGCGSATGAATAATQTITLNSLVEATYNCTLTVTDTAGNPSIGLALSAFTIDITAPTGTASVGTATLFEGDLVQEVTITYNEPMDPVSTPTINFAGTAGAFTVVPASGTWSTSTTWLEDYTIADANEEIVGATVDSSGATDFATNVEGPPVNTTFNVDTLAPTLPTVTIASDNANPAVAVAGDTVTLTITSSETINQPTVVFTSGAAAVAQPTVYGGAWTADYLTDAADTDGVVGYTIDFTDTPGNTGTQVTATTDASAVDFDNAGPSLVSTFPADDGTNIATGTSLSMTFDENLAVGTGNITIYKSSDDSVFEALDVTGAGVTFNGTTGVTINPTADFANSTAYYVQVDATAIEDGGGLPYVGIADKTTWNFTTVAATSPSTPSSSGGGGGGYRTDVGTTTDTTTEDPADETGEEPTGPNGEPMPDGSTGEASTPTGIILWDIAGHWSEPYIDQAYVAGYIEGYEDESFKPNQYITRAEVAKLVAMWLNPALTDTDCDAAAFDDVSCSDWYGTYVTYLYSQEIVEGYNNGGFGPGMNITRAEALKMLLFAKALQDMDISDLINPFSDISQDNWFYNLVLIGYDLTIVQGYEDGTFMPGNNITRGEFLKIFVETLLNN